MKYCTNCVSPSSAPLPGKTSSNGCYYALRQNKNIISASNSSPSHSLTLESFAQVKTCNQFTDKREQFVLDCVPFTGTGRKVADGDFKAGFVGESLEVFLPELQPVPVRSSRVRRNHQSR